MAKNIYIVLAAEVNVGRIKIYGIDTSEFGRIFYRTSDYSSRPTGRIEPVDGTAKDLATLIRGTSRGIDWEKLVRVDWISKDKKNRSIDGILTMVDPDYK